MKNNLFHKFKLLALLFNREDRNQMNIIGEVIEKVETVEN